MKLATTDRQLHELEQIEDKARAGSEMVRVPRDALRNLLRDHITLNGVVAQRCGALPETVKD
jgi:hypothetical protein